ncbi:hypothetical protein F5Y14DRAFT_399381 [Nemania sp. NC0429]|nr:hypothetical protein F5Y14DRAFT_399381 [Nemania sp. NC0429]
MPLASPTVGRRGVFGDKPVVLFLSDPIDTRHIGLGSVVLSPWDPASAYTPRDPAYFAPNIRDLRSASSLINFRYKSEGEPKPGFFNHVLWPTPTQGVEITSARVVQERLFHHDQVLERIFRKPETKNAIVAMMGDADGDTEERELFLVVGLMIGNDMRTVARSAPASGESFEGIYEGDKIFAINYRSLKVRNKEASTDDAIQLGDYFPPRETAGKSWFSW